MFVIRRHPRTTAFSASRSCFSSSSPNHGDGGRETHFGFQRVAENEKWRRVGDVFHSVANQYDLMNDLMSGGVHRIWKDCFVAKLSPSRGATYLDVAGGTGDIAFRIVDRLVGRPRCPGLLNLVAPGAARGPPQQESSVIVADINSSMLEVGRARSYEKGYQTAALGAGVCLDFVQADAEALPLPDNAVDAYTIAFGIRNCTHIDRVLSEAYRVLKRGGRFLCLEFSAVDVPFLRELYSAYSFNVIPLIGDIVAKDRGSYQYLVESIRQFPAQQEFADMIRAAGFRHVDYENHTFGVVAIHSGFKV